MTLYMHARYTSVNSLGVHLTGFNNFWGRCQRIAQAILWGEKSHNLKLFRDARSGHARSVNL